MVLGFFGQELGSDEDIDVVISNTAIAAWFERNRDRQRLIENWRNTRNPTTARKIINVAKHAAKALGVVSTIIRALSTNHAREEHNAGRMVRKRRPDVPDQVYQAGRERGAGRYPDENEGFNNVGGPGLIENSPGNLDNLLEGGRDNDDSEDPMDEHILELINERAQDPTEGMDIDEGAGQPETGQRLAIGGGGPGNQVSKETPISRYPTLTYGLQETHTTILPWTGYLAATGFDHVSPVVIDLRLTQPQDVLAKVVQGLAAGAAWGKDVYSVPYNNNATRSTATAAEFPAVVSTGGAAPGGANTEKATWWDYWKKLYEYYTVLGCEYEIIINNPGSQVGTEGVVGWDFNAHTDTAGASGNITPQDQRLAVMKQYKGIQWRTIAVGNENGSGRAESNVVIKGRYTPGQARRNIVNDGDVKTWIKTNGATAPDSPTLKEFLTLYFFRHELAYFKPADRLIGVNMQITLKYIVQFKDLYRNARYPNTSDGDITQVIDTDAMQFPIT